MTVVAAIAQAGRVVMAADTAAMTNSGQVVYGRRKIERHRTEDGHEMLLAFAGGAALPTLVSRHLKVDAVPGEGADDAALTAWAEAIAEAVADIATDAKPPLLDKDGMVDGGGMLAYRGRIWTLNQQAATLTPLGYWAIGSGSDLALGFMYGWAGRPGDRASLDTVTGAVEAACLYDDACRVAPGGGPQIEVLG